MQNLETLKLVQFARELGIQDDDIISNLVEPEQNYNLKTYVKKEIVRNNLYRQENILKHRALTVPLTEGTHEIRWLVDINKRFLHPINMRTNTFFMTYGYLVSSSISNWKPKRLYLIVGNNTFEIIYTNFLEKTVLSDENYLKSFLPENIGLSTTVEVYDKNKIQISVSDQQTDKIPIDTWDYGNLSDMEVRFIYDVLLRKSESLFDTYA